LLMVPSTVRISIDSPPPADRSLLLRCFRARIRTGLPYARGDFLPLCFPSSQLHLTLQVCALSEAVPQFLLRFFGWGWLVFAKTHYPSFTFPWNSGTAWFTFPRCTRKTIPDGRSRVPHSYTFVLPCGGGSCLFLIFPGARSSKGSPIFFKLQSSTFYFFSAFAGWSPLRMSLLLFF